MKTIFILFMLITALSVGLYAQGLTIGSGTTFSLGSATLTLPNNWSNSGTFDPGNGTVVLSGSSGDQTIENISGETFNNITVDKSAGNLVMNDDITINGTLALISGDLDMNGNTITLASTATVSESAGSTIVGTSGMITTTRTLTAPNITTDIGGLGISISSTADLGSTFITRGHAAQDGGASILRYYDIAPTNNSGLAATVRFKYDESELNSNAEDELGLIESTDAGASWSTLGGSVDTLANYVQFSPLDAFARLSAKAIAAQTLIYLSSSWNLVSLPRVVTNDSAHIVFIGKNGSMYSYNTATGVYDIAPTLPIGLGYWVNYPGTDSVTIVGGSPSSPTATAAQAGWVMIGSRETPVSVSSLILSGGAVINGSVYLYDPSLGTYVATTMIDPGAGVWINVDKACTITIP